MKRSARSAVASLKEVKGGIGWLFDDCLSLLRRLPPLEGGKEARRGEKGRGAQPDSSFNSSGDKKKRAHSEEERV